MENDTILYLLNKYRGLDVDDLDTLNPTYSCVICANTKCEHHNKPNHSCPECTQTTEEEWAKFYNFKSK